MKIQLKRSNQLDGGSAKAPSIGYMEYGELAVNFNEADPCIFIKASDGAGTDSIVRIAGAGAESGGLPNGGTDERPDTPSVGDLFFDTDLNLIVYWDGNQWVPVSPGVITSDSKPTESLYAAGTLWYNSDEAEGALYILYEDPAGPGANAGGKVWVQIAGGSGGGGGSVIVADNPPNAADEGDLWFDSDSGRLYIWYINTNSQGQWVDASPDGGGDADGSDFVSKVDTASQNIVSDLTLGTDKITLNATNGNATFAGGDASINSAGEFFTEDRNGYFIKTGGQDYSAGIFSTIDGSSIPHIVINAGNLPAIAINETTTDVEFCGAPGNNGNINNPLATIKGDGSANFNGDGLFNKIGDNYRNRLYGGGLISSFNSFDGNSIGMHLDIGDAGSANPPQLALIANSGATGDALLIQRQGQTSPDVKLKYDGSAEFAGNIGGAGIITAGNDTDGSAFCFDCRSTETAWRAFNWNLPEDTPGIRWERCTSYIKADGEALFAGSITAPNVNFNLEPDNDANYVTTTEEYTETESYTGPLGNTLEREVTKTRDIRTYTGPTLDVKDRLQNLIARLDALEADEISDDAASNALLTLIASLTARVDARDAVIAELTNRIQTLEGGNN